MKLDVLNLENKKAGEFEVSDKLLETKVSDDLIHDVLLAYLHNQHTGSSNTKTRAEVRGGGIKPWKQKHTGRARHGSIRSPIWKGGGVTFGPRPVQTRITINKKSKAKAMQAVIAAKLKDSEITLLESLGVASPKTKEVVSILKKMNLGGTKVLFVTEKNNAVFVRAARNIAKVETTTSDKLNIYQLLTNAKVVAEKGAMEKILERLA